MFFQLCLLAVVQGLTEFLPISSSGHLVIARDLLGMELENPLLVDVALHVGTLVAVLAVFGGDVVMVIRAVLRWVLSPRSGESVPGERRVVLALILGTLPAVVVGLALEDWIESRLARVVPVGIALLATAAMLVVAGKTERRIGGERLEQVSLATALWVGCAQAIAVLPGCSRSGWTISAGLQRGIARPEAARFSFLLAVPVISGAALLQAAELASGETRSDFGALELLAAMGIAAVSGYLACRLLLVLLRRGRFPLFAIYCALVGVACIVFGASGA